MIIVFSFLAFSCFKNLLWSDYLLFEWDGCIMSSYHSINFFVLTLLRTLIMISPSFKGNQISAMSSAITLMACMYSLIVFLSFVVFVRVLLGPSILVRDSSAKVFKFWPGFSWWCCERNQGNNLIWDGRCDGMG